ncbi:KinB-signaling pathway activation protein [Halalkalibacterium halodurans]|uniref:Activation of the KinB signalling pathway of sporulation n=2 Tax=Halalkalibacterium halodurans TaxID=86665 RepID=Q9KG70_HALH5|nr:KinB-signaling pathway activation protein [Halalkalibacterium halodurans]MDY7220756.1 KinB-signaling pathway activation protein [Halalkalibacterium halodurans]MDY7239995.1 KinB-signaling pathway activation protein [Halalkalibacterium halodurans]MED3647001.1 KinB-signaling pathway activation protein [Halalkalibacterium halodurans]MED4082835.1 KinB-signaling pathway activation protein [Halalkalibacterium halodurans]MED4083246.1 KinB-signaling pathway activation protein [Halalkalibacterium hal
MNTRKVVQLFFTTLIIGSLSGTIVGLLLDLDLYTSGSVANLIVGIIWIAGISAAFSLIAQMGFFAYLTLHRFGLGIFKSVKLWNWVQVILIAFVVFDLIYLRYIAFAQEGETIFHYMVMPLALLVYGAIIAYLKAKDTNKGAFIPALFFMVVITSIEWVPALTVNDPKWLWVYFAPLIAANTWQILILHRLQQQ